ncbi:MAG: ABC transporter substrate-binding protein [Desulfuromonadaceae bacterium]|nr:ABC transporter substrate-binding protein [Desulfuromonadaceae bacterium]MDD5107638.1 ABC transporter substrate-binding protein [Desulfuromonadaceae bacterium]
MNFRLWKWVLTVCVCGICCSEAIAAESQGCLTGNLSQTRYVTDMAGRKVTVPRKISRIATIGAVPVINSYLIALGEGRKIVNGLPSFARTRWQRMQTAIAPHLAEQPVLQGQGQGRSVNAEVLLKLCPDIIITMDMDTLRILEKSRITIPVIYTEWRDIADVKASMSLLADVLDRTAKSNEYLRYFETIMAGVRKTSRGLSKSSMPKVLFFNPDTLTQPPPIVDWWIHEAGGQSVTTGLQKYGNAKYSHEQILLWNPDIMIVYAPDKIARVYQDKRLSKVNAVVNKRVYCTPISTHSWGNRTIEQPLTVLWAAKHFHPDRFKEIDLVAETKTFYRRFFGYNLSDKEANEMINGEYEK